MAKRFITSDMWTQNVWFRKLEPKYKLFWIYLITSCDGVGVWREDVELASYMIGYDYNRDDVLEAFGRQVEVFGYNNGKWWLKKFCSFQYGTLDEDSGSKPIQSYVRLLKHHGLWESYLDYTKSNLTLKEKDKKKEKGQEREKDLEHYGDYNNVELTRQEFDQLTETYGPDVTQKAINYLDEYMESKTEYKKKVKNHKAVMQTWVIKSVLEHSPPLTIPKTMFQALLRKYAPISKKYTYDTANEIYRLK